MVKDDGGRSVLFDPGERRPADSADRPAGSGRPRLRYANRQQVEFRACAWDDLVPEDHQVRIVWAYVEGLDLSALLEPIRAVQGHAGAPPADPRVLMTLWLYATLRGIGSARELARRCDPETGEVAFQWICGGVSMNYHTLADFRVAHMELLDQFLTQGVAALRHEGLVDLERVAQDGMRVRASAGSCSFRRRKTLEDHLAEAEAHLEALKEELDSDSAAASRRQQAARKRAWKSSVSSA